MDKSFKSHPMRVRGLKCLKVWSLINPIPSHPMRVRGLKFAWLNGIAASISSHPMRVRGLKFLKKYLIPFLKCRTLCGCVD